VPGDRQLGEVRELLGECLLALARLDASNDRIRPLAPRLIPSSSTWTSLAMPEYSFQVTCQTTVAPSR